jgi:hypothetical protein
MYNGAHEATVQTFAWIALLGAAVRAWHLVRADDGDGQLRTPPMDPSD